MSMKFVRNFGMKFGINDDGMARKPADMSCYYAQKPDSFRNPLCCNVLESSGRDSNPGAESLHFPVFHTAEECSNNRVFLGRISALASCVHLYHVTGAWLLYTSI